MVERRAHGREAGEDAQRAGEGDVRSTTPFATSLCLGKEVLNYPSEPAGEIRSPLVYNQRRSPVRASLADLGEEFVKEAVMSSKPPKTWVLVCYAVLTIAHPFLLIWLIASITK